MLVTFPLVFRQENFSMDQFHNFSGPPLKIRGPVLEKHYSMLSSFNPK